MVLLVLLNGRTSVERCGAVTCGRREALGRGQAFSITAAWFPDVSLFLHLWGGGLFVTTVQGTGKRLSKYFGRSACSFWALQQHFIIEMIEMGRFLPRKEI